MTKIHDATNSTHGFRDSAASTNVAPTTTADWDFSYDAKGNIKSDKNKRITGIKYNHLNQPVEIKFNNSNNSVITYLYNASGQKVQKAVKQIPQGAQAAATTTTDYLNGFQYMNNVLQFFPTSEGYVRNTVVNEVNNYSYVYHYTDHLGNVRLSYAKDPDTNVLKILEENHYYPYGVKHTNYNSNLNAFAGKMAGGIELKAVAATVPGGGATEQPYNYKYNGIEYQEELLLNMYDMPLRDYDPASAKWFNIDPVTHYDQSPFMAMNGNPVTFSDPSGANGHNWNPYSDMSMNNYGANGTSSPGRNSNGDNDGGSSIFWGSSRMLFEQSYEGHILNSIFSTTDNSLISGILNQYSHQTKGWTHYSWTEVSGEGSSGLTASFMNVQNNDNGMDLSSLFDKQTSYTREYFSKKSEALESMTLFPGSKELTKLIYFTKMVETGAPFDLKNRAYNEASIGKYSSYHGYPMRFDDYGNYNYGVAAKAYGISLRMAIIGAGINQVSKGVGHITNPQGWFDDPRDTRMIIMGYNAN